MQRALARSTDGGRFGAELARLLADPDELVRATATDAMGILQYAESARRVQQCFVAIRRRLFALRRLKLLATWLIRSRSLS
jgi:hypothetical protein